jgi:hypothetical protein
MPLPSQPPDECAHCGAEIPRHAKACPECGADELTGWREKSVYDGLNLPDEALEDEASDRSGRPPATARVNGVAWYWWLVGIVLLVLLAGSMLGLR